jgi:hypothetical protein
LRNGYFSYIEIGISRAVATATENLLYLSLCVFFRMENCGRRESVTAPQHVASASAATAKCACLQCPARAAAARQRVGAAQSTLHRDKTD